jgi:hypothetical protein
VGLVLLDAGIVGLNQGMAVYHRLSLFWSSVYIETMRRATFCPGSPTKCKKRCLERSRRDDLCYTRTVVTQGKKRFIHLYFRNALSQLTISVSCEISRTGYVAYCSTLRLGN